MKTKEIIKPATYQAKENGGTNTYLIYLAFQGS